MKQIQILDGGMGRELDRRGAPFRRPEWSALALVQQPSAVQTIHEDFIQAGANIITTNSYAVVPFHIGEDTFNKQGKALAQLSGQLALQAKQNQNSNTIIAGCIPPLFGSYRADLFIADKATTIAKPLISGLTDYADIWLLETQSLIAEAITIIDLLDANASSDKNANNTNQPIWVAFTLEDDIADAKQEPKLRSGEPVVDAINAMMTQINTGSNIQAILFNCCQPEVIEHALITAQQTLNNHQSKIQLGAYANAFPPQKKSVNVSEFHNHIRDLTPKEYLDWARVWRKTGASIIGGCCGIGPEHIDVLANGLK